MNLPRALSPLYKNTTLLYYRISLPIGLDKPAGFLQMDHSGMANKLQSVAEREQAQILKTLGRELDAGSTVYIVEDDAGRIVHYSCVGSNKIWKTEIKLYLNLPCKERYIYNCRTLPDHCRQGLFTSAIDTIIRTYGPAYISCDETNHTSRRVIEKFSPDFLGKIQMLQVLGIYQRCKNTTGLEFTMD